MNREEASLYVQVAINQMISTIAVFRAAESMPDDSVVIKLGENADEVTILNNGTVIYKPKEIIGTVKREVKTFSIGEYAAIVSPPYDPVGKQICNACGGTGRLP